MPAMAKDEERLRRAAAFVSAGLRGDFTPQVDRVFSGLDQVVEAHRHLEFNRRFGKIVLTPRGGRRTGPGRRCRR